MTDGHDHHPDQQPASPQGASQGELRRQQFVDELEQLETNQQRVDAILQRIQGFFDFADQLQERVGIDMNAVEQTIRGLEGAEPETFTSQAIEVIQNMIRILESEAPDLFERIQRRIFVTEGVFTSLDDEDFMSYGVGDHGWAHMHVAPGRTLGERMLPLMASGMRSLCEIVQEDEEIQGVTATSPIVASRKYGALLEQLGFELRGEVSAELRERHFPTVPADTPIHEAVLTRENIKQALAMLGRSE